VNELNAQFRSVLKREIKTLPNKHVTSVCYFTHTRFLCCVCLFYVKYRVVRSIELKFRHWDFLDKSLIRYIQDQTRVSYTVIINIDILTVTAKSFPCALWSVPFLLLGLVGRIDGNASVVIM